MKVVAKSGGASLKETRLYLSGFSEGICKSEVKKGEGYLAFSF